MGLARGVTRSTILPSLSRVIGDGGSSGGGGLRLPSVETVFLYGTSWHDFFRNMVNNGVANYTVVGIGYPVEENELIPWIAVNRIIVEFAEALPAEVDASFFGISGVSGTKADSSPGAIPTIASVSIDGALATIVLSGNLEPSTITVAIPSAGTSGFTLSFKALPCDVLRDGEVNSTDYNSIPVGTYNLFSPQYSIYKDVDGSVTMNSTDRNYVLQNYGATI